MVTGVTKKSSGLEPGVYVAARKLDLPGKPGGKHQFFILIPGKKPGRMARHLMKELGGGTKGIVVGAHNTFGNLNVIWFQEADLNATKERLGVKKPKYSWATQVKRVRLGKQSVDEANELIIHAVNQYVRESLKRPIPYPQLLEQFQRDCINSNSWVHSLLESVIGAGRVIRNFDGADQCHENNIARSYFRGAQLPWRDQLEVKSGDSLSGLCKQVYKKSTPQIWNAVAKANHIKNPNLIYPGMKIKFPELFSL